LTEVWKKKLSEFELVLEGKDPQLVQAYAHYSKTQIKNIIKFIEQVIADLNAYISVKKAAKAPRKRKTIPVEKIVAKLKFLKEFKDPALKLELVSLHPTKLHGASEAWVYDSAKRKLHHYIADEYSKTFSVKGNTLLGFCTKQSEMKTLRKPNEQIKEIMGSKPAARKYFKDIKAVGAIPNGRFNENMLILKAF
jgi:succinate dehydrogenase flavin-adding protein (antitoxin of CptAB toxin-antitoxin module)